MINKYEGFSKDKGDVVSFNFGGGTCAHILWPSLTTAALLQFIVDGEDKQKQRP